MPEVNSLEFRTAQVDDLVRTAFEGTQPGATVVAVGGYGRRELFPYSDVDLLLLTDALPTAEERQPIAEFQRLLWDAGLRVSQSVHTVAECCEIHEGNLELTISLLDQRYLCGLPARHQALSRQFPRLLNAERSGIVHHLGVMTRGRHAKYGNTIYHLEPNVKEHPGGLRDLHVVHWLHILRSLDAPALAEAKAFLFDVRTRLHQHFRRDNNQLTFEAQELLSPRPEQWMREYYRNARQIAAAAQRVLDRSENVRSNLISQFRDRRSRLSTAEFTVARGQVLLANPALLQTDPGLVMQLMQFLARHQLPLAPDTEARLLQAPALAASWPELSTLLHLPHCVHALRLMAGLGLLQQLVPAWSHIDCLVVRDFYHRYTVDEHTLVTLESLENLPASQETGHRHFAGLLAEVDRPDLLRFALLLHDLGKGLGDGGHAARSATIAEDVLWRLQVPAEESATILFLIKSHLDLSAVMTSRDLNESATAKHVAACAGTIERLKLLTLLTYADISAVNPSAMTPWRLEQLWKTYLIGYEEFTRELGTERIHSLPDLPPESAQLLEGLPLRYLKTHTPAQIAEHVELLRKGNAVELARVNGTYRLTVAAADRPFLLASLSGALASFGMNILKAEVFTNQAGQALDTFIFADPHRTLELNPDESERLTDLVLRAISAKVDVSKLIQRRYATAPKTRVEPTVSSSNDVSETSTLIQIVAEDRPGLLFDLTRTISSAGANIEVVLIDTEAHRALDVFYVQSGGGKLPDSLMVQLREDLVQACQGLSK